MEKLKRENAITLVALVVTIIILLILAGVAILQLTGNEIFENAKLAEQKSKEAQEKEDKTLADYENIIGGYVDSSRDTVSISKEEYSKLKDTVATLGEEYSELKDAVTTYKEECEELKNTVTTLGEENNQLKDSLTTKNINFELTVTPSSCWTKNAYVIGSEVQISIGMNYDIPVGGSNIIGKIPKEYVPIDQWVANAVYLHFGGTKAAVGHITVDSSGNVVIANWAGSTATQVVGTIRYRYK